MNDPLVVGDVGDIRGHEHIGPEDSFDSISSPVSWGLRGGRIVLLAHRDGRDEEAE